MEVVLLKKILHIPHVANTEEWKDYIDESKPGVERDIYWLFNVYTISMDFEPVWWTFFDSLEELNEHLWTKFEEKDIRHFDDVVEEVNERRTLFYKKPWKKEK